MSGFGLRAFKKLKEDSRKQDKRQYIPHIVCGDNEYAVLTYLELRRRFGEEKVRLACRNPVDKQDVINQWKCSLYTVRNENAAAALRDVNARLEIVPGASKVQFYKDGKFHEIDGRARPQKFLEDEEYFKDSCFLMNKENLFSTEDWNDLDEILRRGQINKYIGAVTRTEPKDLVEKTNFVLSTGEHENLECEKLYWCDSPKTFYKLLENKEEVSDAVTAFCAGVEERVGVTVHFDVQGKIRDEAGTVLLPQSATHEWGYFVLDFDAYDPEKNRQTFASMMFVDLDEVNEEELAKKIRLMKRVIGRVFPEFEKTKYSEHYHYNEQALIKNFLDDSFFQNNAEQDILKFVGIGAPVKSDHPQDFLYEARGILSYLQL